MSTLTVTTPTELHLAKRMSRLGTETAFEVLVRARALERQGKNIVHLEIGEPDFDTPGNIVEAAVGALHMGYTHYGPSAGMPDLREAIADDVTKSRGVKFTSDEVVVVPGGSRSSSSRCWRWWRKVTRSSIRTQAFRFTSR
jgi:aspartate aminotransferase